MLTNKSYLQNVVFAGISALDIYSGQFAVSYLNGLNTAGYIAVHRRAELVPIGILG